MKPLIVTSAGGEAELRIETGTHSECEKVVEVRLNVSVDGFCLTLKTARRLRDWLTEWLKAFD